jgi:hypothetical protein
VAESAGTALSDAWGGAQYAVAAILQSPSFLYRAELGEPDPAQSGRLRYTSAEMATRLAYLFWNAPPDDALLDAGERGDLAGADGVRAQVKRLLDSPKARGGLVHFFVEWLELEKLDALQKDAQAFPAFTATIGASMREELTRGLEDFVFDANADYRTLFTRRETFVNAELAQLYGIPAPAGAGFAKVALPAGAERAGLLGTGGLLAIYGKMRTTAPVQRGKFVREMLLCQSIPPPPPGVVASLPDPLPDQPMTRRQAMERHRTDPVCAACHAFTDPIGLAMERFDAIGAFRTQDNGLDIDATGAIDQVAFDGAAGLGKVLSEHPRLTDCFVRSVYRYATGHYEHDGELPSIAVVRGEFEQGGNRVRSLFESIALSDGFRYAVKPGE